MGSRPMRALRIRCNSWRLSRTPFHKVKASPAQQRIPGEMLKSPVSSLAGVRSLDTDWLLLFASVACKLRWSWCVNWFERHLLFLVHGLLVRPPPLLEATFLLPWSASFCFTTPANNKMTVKSLKNLPVPTRSQSSKGTSNPASRSTSPVASNTPPNEFSPVTIHTGSKRKPMLLRMVPSVIESHAASRSLKHDSTVERVLLADRELLVRLTMRSGVSGRRVAESLRRKRPPELKVDDRINGIEVIRFRPSWPNDRDQGRRSFTAGRLPGGQRGARGASSDSKLHPYLRKYPGCVVFRTGGVYDADIPVPYSCIASIKRYHDELVLEIAAHAGFLPVGDVQIKLTDEQAARRLESELNERAVRCLGVNETVKGFGFRPASEIPSCELLNRTEAGYPEMFRGDLRFLGLWKNPVKRMAFDFPRPLSKSPAVS